MTKKVKLPHDFISNKQPPLIYLKNYRSSTTYLKEKIDLEYYLISFVIKGTKTINIQGKTTFVNEGNYLIAKPGRCIMTEKSTSDCSYKSLLIFIHESFINHLLDQDSCIKKQNNKSLNLNTFPFDPYIKNYIYSIENIIENQELNYEVVQIKIRELLSYLQTLKNFSFSYFLKKDNVQNFKTTIENNIKSDLKLEEFAFLCHMSLSTFKREFKKQYHCTPGKWLIEKRLEFSAIELKTNQKKAIDIYFEYGFKSLSSYIQSFKKKFGTTPSKYQKMNF